MPALHAHKFTSYALLQALESSLLYGFLSPYEAYLSSRGVLLDGFRYTKNDNSFSSLGDVLRNPVSHTPAPLIEALFLLNEISENCPFDQLLDLAVEHGVPVPDNDFTEQLALRLWLAAPEVLKKHHREIRTVQARAFEYFRADALQPASFTLRRRALQQLERSLDFWFQKHKYGDGCHVRQFAKGNEIWFLINHGGRFRYVETWQNNQSSTLGYRPERYDIVVYDQQASELRVNALSVRLRDLYRRQFGAYLFGRENHFPENIKYTLDPIRDKGAECLLCHDVPKMQQIRLTRLTYELPAPGRLKRTEAAEDVFKAMQHRNLHLPENARLLSATFEVCFRAQKRPRSVALRSSNVALYSRDEDSRSIAHWLNRRGFTRSTKVDGYEQLECLLQIA